MPTVADALLAEGLIAPALRCAGCRVGVDARRAEGWKVLLGDDGGPLAFCAACLLPVFRHYLAARRVAAGAA